MNQRLTAKLKKTGLIEKEAQVYALLLDGGGLYPSRIAEVTKINRSTVYKTLTALAIKGIVSEIENHKKYFYIPNKLSRLVAHAEVEQKRADAALREAQALFTELPNLVKKDKTNIFYFKGTSGILAVFEDVISSGKHELVCFSNAAAFEDKLPIRYYKEYAGKKKNVGIHTRAIVVDAKKTLQFRERVYGTVGNHASPEVRIFPPDTALFAGDLSVYGESKVSMTKLLSGDVLSIIIEDVMLHGMLKTIFEIVWKNLEIPKNPALSGKNSLAGVS